MTAFRVTLGLILPQVPLPPLKIQVSQVEVSLQVEEEGFQVQIKVLIW